MRQTEIPKKNLYLNNYKKSSENISKKMDHKPKLFIGTSGGGLIRAGTLWRGSGQLDIGKKPKQKKKNKSPHLHVQPQSKLGVNTQHTKK